MFDMIGNILKNLVSKPATRAYPFKTREMNENVRGYISGIDPEACIYCGICDKKCPSDAIKVDKPNRTWTIENYRCIVCSECVIVCPKQCIYMEKTHLTSSTQKDIIVCKGSPKPPKEAANA